MHIYVRIAYTINFSHSPRFWIPHFPRRAAVHALDSLSCVPARALRSVLCEVRTALFPLYLFPPSRFEAHLSVLSLSDSSRSLHLLLRRRDAKMVFEMRYECSTLTSSRFLCFSTYNNNSSSTEQHVASFLLELSLTLSKQIVNFFAEFLLAKSARTFFVVSSFFLSFLVAFLPRLVEHSHWGDTESVRIMPEDEWWTFEFRDCFLFFPPSFARSVFIWLLIALLWSLQRCLTHWLLWETRQAAWRGGEMYKKVRKEQKW